MLFRVNIGQPQWQIGRSPLRRGNRKQRERGCLGARGKTDPIGWTRGKVLPAMAAPDRDPGGQCQVCRIRAAPLGYELWVMGYDKGTMGSQ